MHAPLCLFLQVEDTEKVAELIIDEAMKSGSLQQRNVVGVITGLMGSGKTTLLCRLFDMAPPDLYTSTGVAEQSFRGLLHHRFQLSAGAWSCLSHKEIHELLAPLIRAGMRASSDNAFATAATASYQPPSPPNPPSLPSPSWVKATKCVFFFL